jgi:hypothetical protein
MMKELPLAGSQCVRSGDGATPRGWQSPRDRKLNILDENIDFNFKLLSQTKGNSIKN